MLTWQTFWDALRVVTMLLSLDVLGLAIATWVRPLTRAQHARFFALAGFAATIGVTDLIRLGEPPILYWRLITDVIVMSVALWSVYQFRNELPDSPMKENR